MVELEVITLSTIMLIQHLEDLGKQAELAAATAVFLMIIRIGWMDITVNMDKAENHIIGCSLTF